MDERIKALADNKIYWESPLAFMVSPSVSNISAEISAEIGAVERKRCLYPCTQGYRLLIFLGHTNEKIVQMT